MNVVLPAWINGCTLCTPIYDWRMEGQCVRIQLMNPCGGIHGPCQEGQTLDMRPYDGDLIVSLEFGYSGYMYSRAA